MSSCPVCGEDSLVKNKKRHELTHFGEILIITANCSNCGFNNSEVNILEDNPPARYIVNIENKKDLKTKLIRGSNGTVEIEELGMKLEPGSGANAFFTNIEGLLNRFETVLKSDWDKESDQEAANSLLKELKKVKSGKNSVEVKVSDPKGNSALIGDKVKKKPLEVENSEIEEEKFSDQ